LVIRSSAVEIFISPTVRIESAAGWIAVAACIAAVSGQSVRKTVALPDVHLDARRLVGRLRCLSVAVARTEESAGVVGRLLATIFRHHDEVESGVETAAPQSQVDVEAQLFVEQIEHSIPLIRLNFSKIL